MIRFFYCIYQICVFLPILIVSTIITALFTMIGCTLGNHAVWAYYPGLIWSRLVIAVAFLPVKVEGRENIEKGQSYVFCSNHQGAFDIWLIYGYLGAKFKWMMKESLRKIPFVGKACESAGFIFVDRSDPRKIVKSIDQARHTLKDGMSMLVFPEGHRSLNGKMAQYKRGAFLLADKLQLPVVPITINGSFEVLTAKRAVDFLHWQPLKLIIHKPIMPIGQGAENLKAMEEQSRAVTYSALDERYK